MFDEKVYSKVGDAILALRPDIRDHGELTSKILMDAFNDTGIEINEDLDDEQLAELAEATARLILGWEETGPYRGPEHTANQRGYQWTNE